MRYINLVNHFGQNTIPLEKKAMTFLANVWYKFNNAMLQFPAMLVVEHKAISLLSDFF